MQLGNPCHFESHLHLSIIKRETVLRIFRFFNDRTVLSAVPLHYPLDTGRAWCRFRAQHPGRFGRVKLNDFPKVISSQHSHCPYTAVFLVQLQLCELREGSGWKFPEQFPDLFKSVTARLSRCRSSRKSRGATLAEPGIASKRILRSVLSINSFRRS